MNNSMKQSPSWDASGCSAVQQEPAICPYADSDKSNAHTPNWFLSRALQYNTHTYT